MKTKIITAAFAFCVIASATFAQTKTLSTPSKTETTNTTPQTTTTGKTETTSGTTQTTSNNLSKPTPDGSHAVTPPDVVAAKFKTMYPSVPEAKWMQNKEGNYAAMFKNNGTECRTVFTADGTVKREFTVVQQSALPEAVKNYMAKNEAGKTPKKCEELKNEKGNIIYIIKYDDKLLRLDEKGNEVKMVDEESTNNSTMQKSMTK